MIPVNYPTDIEKRRDLKLRYVKAIAAQTMQNGVSRLDWMKREWWKLRKKMPRGSHYPKDVRKILKAEYPKLIQYYLHYWQNGSTHEAELKKIFSYEILHDAIAEFFMDANNEFNLSVCHYCGMAYINKYTVYGSEKQGLDFINTASADELKQKLHTGNDALAAKIVNGQPNWTVQSFNAISNWRAPNKFQRTFPLRKDYNHFDLDHVIHKDSCWLTAVSLMNFVPSCSVCNEKLKGTQVLGLGRTPAEELSPTSRKFNFDGMVEFMIMPIPGQKIKGRMLANVDKYRLDMNTHGSALYERFVEMFHLRERYEYHKKEALLWMDLKFRYTDNRIAMMANALHDPTSFGFQRIKDDIFQTAMDDENRVFGKLKKDMLK